MRFPFDGEDDDATSVATSGAGALTPTHTEFSLLGATRLDDAPPPLRSRFETAPWPGSTYVIREQATGRAITVVNRGGELRLEDWESGHDKRSHWSCEERGGWLGFRNPEYTTYSKYSIQMAITPPPLSLQPVSRDAKGERGTGEVSQMLNYVPCNATDRLFWLTKGRRPFFSSAFARHSGPGSPGPPMGVGELAQELGVHQRSETSGGRVPPDGEALERDGEHRGRGRGQAAGAVERGHGVGVCEGLLVFGIIITAIMIMIITYHGFDPEIRSRREFIKRVGDCVPFINMYYLGITEPQACPMLPQSGHLYYVHR